MVGRYLLDKACADNDDNPETNGEYYLLEVLLNSKKGVKTVFDVGANLGDWALKACSFLGRDSVLYAFEPVKATFEALSNNVTGVVKPYNFALGEDNGESVVYISKEYAGTNSLIFNDYAGHSNKSEKILVRNGDSFCEENKIGRINLLKIDTEGYELSVLAGFQRMLKERRVDFVQFEYGGTWIYSRSLLKDAFMLFQGNNYRIGKIHPNFLEIFDQYDPKSENFSYSNWLAFYSEVDVPIKTLPHIRVSP